MRPLLDIAWQSALVGVVIFGLLFALDRAAPDAFATPVQWWLLPILFAAHAVPRLVALGIGALRRGPRPRKT